MNKQTKKRILIINNDLDEIAEIVTWLESDMRVPWTYAHCNDVTEAMSHLDHTDLIILKPETEGLATPTQVFEDVDHMVFEVPIIVLANADDDKHGLSTYVMERGAADIVIRGKFERLVDAMEFALIRQKIKTSDREATDKSLKNSNDMRTKEHEDSRNILSMFMGDYSAPHNGAPAPSTKDTKK